MFAFSKPRYLSKRVHPVTQKTEPSYQFDVQYLGSMEEAPLSFLLEAGTSLTVHYLEQGVRDEQEWWISFLQSFLTASTSYFSRPYTTQHLQRILRHVPCHPPVSSVPHRACCIPTMLELVGGQLLIHWKYEIYPARIDIPDDEAIPASSSLEDEPIVSLALPATEIEEWDADAVPEEQATEILADPTMLLERQRVKEARLRAKLAVYRAQYQMSRFQDKYGQEISESESESEESEEDDPSFS